MKFLLIMIPMIFAGCATSNPGGALFATGKCIERPWGAYTFKIATVEKNTYFLYKLGYMGKSIIKLPFDIAHKEYQETACP